LAATPSLLSSPSTFSPLPFADPSISLSGLDAVEKRFGEGKIDPEKQRGMNEKITDGARGMFEKASGYVSP